MPHNHLFRHYLAWTPLLR